MPRDDRRILVGLEDDEVAAAVLAVASRLAAALGARIEAVHVGTDMPTHLAQLARAADIEVAVERGDPAPVLRRRLAEPTVVLGVVGCRDKGGPHPAGHVSLELVEHAAVPVVVVPPRTHVGEEPLHEVLLPLDGARETDAAVDPTITALSGSGLRVTVAHVLDADRVPDFLDQPHHALHAWGNEFLERHAAAGLDIVLRAGRPGQQLLDVVAATEPDLVVVGWSQDLSPGRARTIRELLAASPAPLLLVPTDGADEPAGDPRLVAGDGPDW